MVLWIVLAKSLICCHSLFQFFLARCRWYEWNLWVCARPLVYAARQKLWDSWRQRFLTTRGVTKCINASKRFVLFVLCCSFLKKFYSLKSIDWFWWVCCCWWVVLVLWHEFVCCCYSAWLSWFDDSSLSVNFNQMICECVYHPIW